MNACENCGSTRVIRRRKYTVNSGEEKVQMECKDCGKYFAISEDNKINGLPKSYLEHKQDGSITFSRLLYINEEDAKSPERIIELCGFDPELWEVKRIKLNDWNMGAGDKEQLINHQVKVDIAPKKSDGLSLADIDKFFDNYKEAPRPKRKKKAIKRTGRTLEICLADLHIGNDTLDIAARTRRVITDTLSEAKDIDKIILVPLGDTFHYDTMSRSTTGGTQLNYGMKPYDMYDAGESILIETIDRLSEVAPVEVIAIYGNHDMLMSYALFKGLKLLYRKDKNVTIDTEHLQTKYRKIGNSVVLWNHGDMPVKNLSTLIYNKARKEFGETIQAEIHSGHIHHQKATESGGVLLRHTSTITDTDEWHELNGYVGSLRATMSFVWDLELGLRNIIISSI